MLDSARAGTSSKTEMASLGKVGMWFVVPYEQGLYALLFEQALKNLNFIFSEFLAKESNEYFWSFVDDISQMQIDSINCEFNICLSLQTVIYWKS